MHETLLPEIVQEYLAPMPETVCPIIDFHMHVAGEPQDDIYIKVAREFGVQNAAAMLHGASPAGLREKHGDFFLPITWLQMPEPHHDNDWSNDQIDSIERLRFEGVFGVKLRSACKQGRPDVWVDDPRLSPLLEKIASCGMVVYVHIADPSRWWLEKFDQKIVGPKMDYLKPVLNIIEQHPTLKVIGAHMGGYPEDLPMLSELLDKYPNYYLDTSATKWIVRELGRDSVAARQFFIKYQDRLLFGSDLVTMFCCNEEDYFSSRLWVMRYFMEGERIIPSMIADPDAIHPEYANGPEIRPLNLDKSVLRKIYRDNALKIIEESWFGRWTDDHWLKERLSICRRPAGEKGRQTGLQMNDNHRDLRLWGLNHLDLTGCQKILDIGCGGGGTLSDLHELLPHAKLYGVDYETQMVSLATDITEGFAEITEGNVSELPYEENTFDLVTAVETHFFWPELSSDFAEVLRVVRPGGRFVIISEMYADESFKARNERMVQLGDMKLHTPDELELLLVKAGFADIRVFTMASRNWLAACAVKEK